MLATLNQSATDLGILKRQHALVGPDCLHDRNYLYPFVSSAASDAHGCRRFFLPV